MKKVKVAHIGYGYWGKNILRNLMAMDNVEVTYVCDVAQVNLDKAKKACGSGSIIYTPDYREIIGDNTIEAVIIATPPQTHYKLAMEALKADKHVFIEKPMTMNYQEAIDIVNQGIIKQKQVMVGHTFLYHPVINDLKKLIDSGELGDVYYIDIKMTNLGKYQKDNVTWDLGPHGLSIVEFLVSDKIIDINANGISAIKKGLLDTAYLSIYLSNNKFANIYISWLTPNKERKLTVVGSKKMVIFDDLNSLEPLRIYDKGIEQMKSIASWGDSIVSYRHGNVIIPTTTTGEPLKIELNHFIDCIINNKTPKSNGSSGAAIVKNIEKANNIINSRK